MTEMAINGNASGNASKSGGAYREKRLFDRAMTAEGMRRTRTLALIMGGIAWISAILVPFMRTGYSPQTPVLYGPIQINPVLLLCFPVFAPFLTLKAFDFLNSRAGSDLFHSFPVKRRTLAASFLTAVFLWLVIIIGGSVLCSVAGCAIMHNAIRLDTARVGIFFLQMVAASFLVEMSVFLTMTVTGTYLTNIVTALGLIFLPRFLITAAGEMLAELVPMISSQHLPLFFTNRLNIVTGMIFGFLLGNSDVVKNGPLYFSPSVVYTFLLAAVYAVTGCILFVRRPSETAGRPALGERLQSATRIGIGFLITVPAAMILCSMISEHSADHSMSQITVLAALFLAAFGAMFIYEYLSAHRILPWKKLLTGILAVLLLDAVWIGTGLLMERAYTSEHFDKGRIESVSFTGDGWNTAAEYFSMNSEYRQEYWGTKLRSAVLTDEKVLGIVSLRHEQTAQKTELRDEVEILENDGAVTADSEEGGAAAQKEPSVTLETKICFAGGREVYRNLTYTYDDLEVIWEAAAPVIGDDMLILPRISELNDLFTVDYYGSELAEAYESYRDELRKLTAGKWLHILSDPDSYSGEVIQFYVVKDGSYIMGALPVTEEFPKTSKLLKKMSVPAETETESEAA